MLRVCRCTSDSRGNAVRSSETWARRCCRCPSSVLSSGIALFRSCSTYPFGIMTPAKTRRPTRRPSKCPPRRRSQVIAVMHLLAAQPERNFSLADISAASVSAAPPVTPSLDDACAALPLVVKDEQTAARTRGGLRWSAAGPTDERQREFRPLPTGTLRLRWRAGLLGARRDGCVPMWSTDSWWASHSRRHARQSWAVAGCHRSWPPSDVTLRGVGGRSGDREVVERGIGNAVVRLRQRLTAVLSEVRGADA